MNLDTFPIIETKEIALQLEESQWWNNQTAYDVVKFQFRQDYMCMPWTIFLDTLEQAVGRSVQTIELSTEKRRAHLLDEMEKRRSI